MIIRVFRARVQPGKAADFRQFFEGEALPLVRAQEGLVSAEIGWPMPPTDDEFLMITVWDSVDALRAFAGENWQEARLLAEERPLLRETSVHHYEAASI
jgi:heme-degrading monooxygenase HmoA